MYPLGANSNATMIIKAARSLFFVRNSSKARKYLSKNRGVLEPPRKPPPVMKLPPTANGDDDDDDAFELVKLYIVLL